MQRFWVLPLLVLATVFFSCDTEGDEALPLESLPQQSATDIPLESPTATVTASLAIQSPNETPATSTASTGWIQYVDEQLGFSFSYPADRKLTDMSETNLHDGQITERVLVLEVAVGYDVLRYMQISIARGDVTDTLEEWMVTYSLCDPDLVAETTIGNGLPASLCEAEPGQIIPAYRVAFRHRDKVISVYSLISPQDSVEESELEAIIASIRLADA